MTRTSARVNATYRKIESVTHQTVTGGQGDTGIPMALNESPIMTFAAMTFRRAANVQVPLPSFHHHRAADEVVDRCQFDVVLVTGHRQSIMNDWPVLVMVMRYIMRDQIAPMIHLPWYDDLVIVYVFLQGVHP